MKKTLIIPFFMFLVACDTEMATPDDNKSTPQSPFELLGKWNMETSLYIETTIKDGHVLSSDTTMFNGPISDYTEFKVDSTCISYDTQHNSYDTSRFYRKADSLFIDDTRGLMTINDSAWFNYKYNDTIVFPDGSFQTTYGNINFKKFK